MDISLDEMGARVAKTSDRVFSQAPKRVRLWMRGVAMLLPVAGLFVFVGLLLLFCLSYPFMFLVTAGVGAFLYLPYKLGREAQEVDDYISRITGSKGT